MSAIPESEPTIAFALVWGSEKKCDNFMIRFSEVEKDARHLQQSFANNTENVSLEALEV